LGGEASQISGSMEATLGVFPGVVVASSASSSGSGNDPGDDEKVGRGLWCTQPLGRYRFVKMTTLQFPSGLDQ